MIPAGPEPDDVLEEWRRRADGGEAPDPEDVIRAHPEISEALRERFEAVRLLERIFAAPGASATGGPAGRSRIGEYEILREIGRGGMGVVYEALQPGMDRRVALKVLPPSLAPPRNAVERFRQEARIAGRLRHANIVPVHTLGEEDGVWYCAMDLVDGPPLSRVLDGMREHGGPRAPEGPGSAPSSLTAEPPGSEAHHRAVARLFAEVADALATAHAAGVLHRDVKPSNLLLAPDGRLCLADFGLARIEGQATLTRTGDLVGTPLYMSPEHLRGRDLTAASDVYSLGATLYEVLTLRPPHEASDPARLTAQILTQDPPAPRSLAPTLSRDLENVVLKALEKEPARRYASAADLAEDLRAFSEGEPVRARPVSPWRRAARTVRRHRVVAVALGVAAVGAAVAGSLASDADAEAARRRDAEYRLLLERAAAIRPRDGDEDAPGARTLYTRAIALSPERPEAYVARSVGGGETPAVRLADIEAAERRGLPPEQAALLRALAFEIHGPPEQADAAWTAAGPLVRADDALARLVVACHALRKRDYPAAEEAFRAARDRLPRSTPLRWPVLRGLLEVHLAGEQHAEALDDVHTLQAAGDDRVKLAALEAWLWRRLGKAEEADGRAEALIAAVAANEDAATNVAYAWWNWGAFDWMARLADRALAEFPDSGDLWGMRATAHDGRYQYAEAIAAWEEACRRAPGSGWLEARRARTLLHAGRLPEARSASERAMGLAPADTEVLTIRGEVLLRSGDLAGAGAAAQGALRIDPDHGDAALLLARVHATAGRLAEAEALIQARLERAPGNPKAGLLRAMMRVAERRFPEALAAADVALRAEPRNADLLELRGTALVRLDRLGEAEVAFREAIAARPGAASGYRALGKLHGEQGRWAEAAEVLTRAVEIDEGNPDAWNDLGNARKSLDDLEGARAAYERALAIDGESLTYLANRAGILIDLGRPEEALPILDRLVARRPADPVERFNRAMAYAALRRTDEAVAEYLEAARLDPGDPVAPMHAGGLLASVGRFEEAVQAIGQAIERAPGNSTYRHDLAIVYLRMERYEDAERSVREAIERRAADPSAQSLLGHLLLRRDRAQEALPHLEEARRLQPEEPGHHQECAAAYCGVGREGAGADLLADAVRRFPEHHGLRIALAWILVDAADPDVRNATQAALHARKATEIDPGRAAGWAILGAALYRQERHGEAIARLEQARAAGGASVEPLASCYLAMALAKSGRGQDARAAFEEAERVRAAPGEDSASNRRRAAEVADVLGLPAPR